MKYATSTIYVAVCDTLRVERTALGDGGRHTPLNNTHMVLLGSIPLKRPTVSVSAPSCSSTTACTADLAPLTPPPAPSLLAVSFSFAPRQPTRSRQIPARTQSRLLGLYPPPHRRRVQQGSIPGCLRQREPPSAATRGRLSSSQDLCTRGGGGGRNATVTLGVSQSPCLLQRPHLPVALGSRRVHERVKLDGIPVTERCCSAACRMHARATCFPVSPGRGQVVVNPVRRHMCGSARAGEGTTPVSISLDSVTAHSNYCIIVNRDCASPTGGGRAWSPSDTKGEQQSKHLKTVRKRNET